MFGSLFELKNANFGIFSNQKLVIKGNNSCQKQCFIKIYLQYMKTYILKLSYVFYCNLICKLKLIKQNVIFCSFFIQKLIFKGNNSCMNKCSHVSYNNNIQFFKINLQNNFRPIANNIFQIIVLLPILHLFFLYKQ